MSKNKVQHYDYQVAVMSWQVTYQKQLTKTVAKTKIISMVQIVTTKK